MRSLTLSTLVRLISSLVLTLASVSVYAGTSALNQQCMPTLERMQGANLLYFGFHYEDTQGRIGIPSLNDRSGLLASLQQQNFSRMTDISGEYVLGEGGSNHWLRFCLSNKTDTPQSLVLATSPAVLAEVDFYPSNSDTAAFQTGNTQRFNSRDINSPQFHFNVFLGAGETQHFYMRVKSRTKAYIRASIWSVPEYRVAKDHTESLDGLYVGILLGLMLYTMLLYIWVRDPLSLLYMLWCSSIIGLFAAIDGRVLQYVLPNHPELAYSFTVIFYPVSVFVSALFARQFLKLRDFPLFDKIGKALIAIAVVIVAIAYPSGYVTYFKACALIALMVVVYFGVIAPVYGLVAKRSLLCKYLLIAQLPLIVCIIDRTLFTMAVSTEYLVPYTPKVGLGATMVLMALCNGLITYRDKYEAQGLAIERLEAANRIKSNYNVELETEVENKTAKIREINVELEEQKQELLKLDEVKSTFFANISHEFRTPITLIQGPLSNLLEQRNDPDRRVISGAIKQSKALQEMVDQLLMLSKFDGQSLSLRATKINVSDAISLSMCQFSSLAESNGVALSFHSAAPLVEAYLDLEKLQVMVNNLLSNALKFTPRDGRVIVEVTSTADTAIEPNEFSTDEYVEIRVSDTGYGIPDDELNFVFDRFFQSRSSVLEGSGIGTGIGLALVKELAELHGGEVGVAHRSQASNVNIDDKLVIERRDLETGKSTGTVFTIRLPLGNAHLAPGEIFGELNADAIPTMHAKQSEGQTNLNANEERANISRTSGSSVGEPRPKILIVDDNRDMRAYIRSLLEGEYKVVEAQDGLVAEEVAKHESPDLIITDLMMPKRDGIGFVESLKSNTNSRLANTSIIMLTAKAGLNDRLTGLMAAVDDYLTKPFDAGELRVRIRNLLKKQAQFHAFYGSSEFADGSSELAPEGGCAEKVENKEHKFVEKARLIVDKHLSKPDFGVNELAQHLHVSRATLARRLSEATQFTPSEFIRHCRLEKARQLSSQGSAASIKELAAAVGFSQASYFSRLYQKTFNSHPI